MFFCFFLVFGAIHDAFSLEPTGTAVRRMKAGRGHVCKITVYWSRSNSSRYSPCRYRTPFIARRGRIRLFGANNFLSSLYHVFFYFYFLLVFIAMHVDVDLFIRAGRPCPCIGPRGNPKGTQTNTSQEAERQESSGSSSSSIRNPIGFICVTI